MDRRDQSLHILQHALGLDEYGRGNPYRNHYVTGEGCDSWDECMAHVEAGRMERHGPSQLFGGGGGYCFTVTKVGIAYMFEHSPKPPKASRAKKRYATWLRVSEAYPDMTFGEWLKMRKGGEP